MAAAKEAPKGDGVINTQIETDKTERFVDVMFAKLKQDVSFTRKSKEMVSPVNALGGINTPAHFNVPAYVNCVYNVDKIGLELHVILLNAKTQLPAADGVIVGPVNNVANSMIKSINISLYDETVNGRNQILYPFRSQMDQMLTFSLATKNDMAAEGFVMDTRGHYNPSYGNNRGFVQRRSFLVDTTDPTSKKDIFKKGPVPLTGTLSTDFDNINKFLLPNVPLKITLNWNEAKFYLMQDYEDDDEYELKVVNALLYVDKLELSQNALQAFHRKWNNYPVVYHLNEVLMGHQIIPQNTYTFASGLINTEGKTPFKIFIVFVDALAFSGDKHLNPFDFRRHWLKNPAKIPQTPLTPATPVKPNLHDPWDRFSAQPASHPPGCFCEPCRASLSAQPEHPPNCYCGPCRTTPAATPPDDQQLREISQQQQDLQQKRQQFEEEQRKVKAAAQVEQDQFHAQLIQFWKDQDAAVAAKAAAEAAAKTVAAKAAATAATSATAATARPQRQVAAKIRQTRAVNDDEEEEEKSEEEEPTEEDKDFVLRDSEEDEDEEEAEEYLDDEENAPFHSDEEEPAPKEPKEITDAEVAELAAALKNTPATERHSYLSSILLAIPRALGISKPAAASATKKSARSSRSRSSSSSITVLEKPSTPTSPTKKATVAKKPRAKRVRPVAAKGAAAKQTKRQYTKRKSTTASTPVEKKGAEKKSKTDVNEILIADVEIHAEPAKGGSAGLQQTGSGPPPLDSNRHFFSRPGVQGYSQGGATGEGGSTGGKTPPPDDDPAAAIEPELTNPKKDYVFIKKIELNLNGMTYQGINSDSSKHDCLEEFRRFKAANGSFRTRFSEGISYLDYNSNSFICGFDLATSEIEELRECVNSVITSSQIRASVSFSEPIPKDLVMVTYCVYSNAIKITSPGKVSLTYVNNIN